MKRPLAFFLSIKLFLASASSKLTLLAIFLTALLLPSISCATPPLEPLHWNKGRGYRPFTHITPEGILLSNASDQPLMDSIALNARYPAARLRFRTDNRHSTPRKSYRYTTHDGEEHTRKNPPWAIFISDNEGRACWLTVAKNDVPDNDLEEDKSGTLLTITADSTMLSRHAVREKTLPFTGETLWTIELSDGRLRIIAGASEPTEIAVVSSSVSDISSFGFASSPGGEILVSDISLMPLNPTSMPLSSTFTPTDMDTCLKDSDGMPDFTVSTDPIEGYYEIFDRTLDESLLKLGGKYKLAIVKNHDRYDIIYLSGAKINGNRWKYGMLKGILTPTSFDDIYDLTWYDAEGEPLSESITAQSGYGGTITLQFPYHSSTLRLRKTK